MNSASIIQKIYKPRSNSIRKVILIENKEKFQKIYSSIQEAAEYIKFFSSKYSINNVIDVVEQINDMKILLLGETIIDEYAYGRVIGKSGKEPILVLKHDRTEKYSGGILNMANHLSDFCNDVGVFTMLGDKDFELNFVKNTLDKKVELNFFCKNNSPTIVKKRFLESAPITKIFEVYSINDEDLDEEQSKQVSERLRNILPNYDLVICIDYGHGMLDERNRKVIVENARFLAVNTQANAGNFGYNTISKYSHADYISLAEPEIRLEARNRFGSLENIIKQVAEKLNCNKLIITRSKDGCLGYDGKQFYKCPSFADKTVDKMGAGDAFLVLSAPLAKNNVSLDMLAFVGNAVGSLAINIIGNKSPITKKDLYEFINYILT